MKIYNIKDKEEYLKEVLTLQINKWGRPYQTKEELEERIDNKIDKIKKYWNNNDYCKLILLDNDNLVGFISIFPQDGEEELNLSPWYATMYVKEEYRGRGLSKILNDAILKEAKKRGYNRIYLKTELVNYYEKFGATYLKNISDNEKVYYFDI